MNEEKGFPEKSLVKLAYKIYKSAKEKRNIPKTKLKLLHKEELDVPEPRNRWIQRLLEHKLLLYGPKTGTYLTYHPQILLYNIFEEDIVEFKKNMLNELFTEKIILTSEDISDYTRDGLISTDVDCILRDRKLYDTVKKSFRGVNYWYIPHVRNKLVLAVFTNMVTCDARALVAAYQAYHKLTRQQKTRVVELMVQCRAPSIPLMFNVLKAKKERLASNIAHPEFKEEWDMFLTVNPSGNMFLEDSVWKAV